MAQVIWGGRTFSSAQQLAAWLKARGSNYTQWKANHPAAASKLEGTPLPAAAPEAQGPSARTAPNWQSAIQDEPIATYDLGQVTAGNQVAAAQRAQQIQQLATRYGAVPGGFNDVYGDLEGVGPLAAGNAYSTLAQIKRQGDAANAGMIADRASRGVLSSGGTALQSKELGYQRGMAEQQALDNFLTGANQANTSFAEQARALANSKEGIWGDAKDRLIAAGIIPSGGSAPGKDGIASSILGVPRGPGMGQALDQMAGPGAAAYHPGDGPGVYRTFAGGGPQGAVAARLAKMKALYGSRATPTINEGVAQEQMRRTFGASRPGDPDWINPHNPAAVRAGMSLGTVPNNLAARRKQFPGLFAGA